MPPDNDFETFSREFDRIYSGIDGPTMDGTSRTNIISPIEQTVTTADRDGDWIEFFHTSNVFSTPFLEYTNPGILETDRGHVRIQGFDLIDVIRQLSREEKRKVLELLLEAFDEMPEEKPITAKKVNRLRKLLMHSKKSAS